MVVTKKYDYIIVGTGTGGSTVAKELANKNKDILIVEFGPKFTKTGLIKIISNIYLDKRKGLVQTTGGIWIGRARILGGSSYFAQGNAVTPPISRLKEWGIDLSEELASARKDLHVTLMPDHLIGEGTKRLIEGARSLGWEMKNTPKCVDFSKCVACGKCAFGCPVKAKWTGVDFVNEALDNNAKLLLNTEVKEVLHKKGEVIGIKARQNGVEQEIFGEKVILAAGALETPRILQNTGISEAGKGLALDAFQTTYGYTEDVGMQNEAILATYLDNFIEDKELFPAPYMYPTLSLVRDVVDYMPTKLTMPNMIKTLLKARKVKAKRLLGMMTKIRDEITGEVMNDGTVVKELTEKDEKKLAEAHEINKKILIASGAKPETVFTGVVEAGHPCCTAPMGKIVDKNQQTEINGLFVSDASVFPSPLGLPPILTIVALSKKLAKYLVTL